MSCYFSRNELYDKVWSEPISALALKIGVSNTAVSKACRKANIPRPGSRYWAKLRSGKRVQKIDLPLRFPGISATVHFGDRWMTNLFSVELDEPLNPMIEFPESLEELRVRVSQMIGKVTVPAE